jgi:CHASE2 domain-containing sensor protein
MSRAKIVFSALMPWSGLVVGLPAFAFVHQFGSAGTFNDCSATGNGPDWIVAVIGIVVCALSGLASWRTASQGEVRKIIALLSASSAVLFVFGILLALIASLMFPPCFQ